MEERKSKPNAIDVEGLVKRFGEFTAVDGISFHVKEGEVFGLLGPNGAGKTTTISIITTIISRTSGTVKLYGQDIDHNKDKARQAIGIVFQDPSLDDELTARENLDFHARLYGVKENRRRIINDMLRLVELMDKADKQVKTFSGGMKRRLEIARGFIHKPKILFLDEPTLGLDPQTRRNIWEYIQRLNKKEGLTIVLTTHYLEEADLLCDRIAIIDHGKIIRMGTPEELKASLGGDVIRLEVQKKAELMNILKKDGFVETIKESSTGLEITTHDGSKAIPKIMQIADSHGVVIDSATLKRPSLEDVFINLTGKSIREEAADAKARLGRWKGTGR
jgi:ABC-2 type transport system ATP-binding protein